MTRRYQWLNTDYYAYMCITGYNFMILAVHIDNIAILALNKQIIDTAK